MKKNHKKNKKINKWLLIASSSLVISSISLGASLPWIVNNINNSNWSENNLLNNQTTQTTDVSNYEQQDDNLNNQQNTRTISQATTWKTTKIDKTTYSIDCNTAAEVVYDQNHGIEWIKKFLFDHRNVFLNNVPPSFTANDFIITSTRDDNLKGILYLTVGLQNVYNEHGSIMTGASNFVKLEFSGFNTICYESIRISGSTLYYNAANDTVNSYPSAIVKNELPAGYHTEPSKLNLIISHISSLFTTKNGSRPIKNSASYYDTYFPDSKLIKSIEITINEYSNSTGLIDADLYFTGWYDDNGFFDPNLKKHIKLYNPPIDSPEYNPNFIHPCTGVTKIVNQVVDINDPKDINGNSLVINPFEQFKNKSAMEVWTQQMNNFNNIGIQYILDNCFVNLKYHPSFNGCGIDNNKIYIEFIIRYFVTDNDVISKIVYFYFTGFQSPINITQNSYYPTIQPNPINPNEFIPLKASEVANKIYSENNTNILNAVEFNKYFIVSGPNQELSNSTIKFNYPFIVDNTENSFTIPSVSVYNNGSHIQTFNNNGAGFKFTFPILKQQTYVPTQICVPSGAFNKYPFECIVNDQTQINNRNNKIIDLILKNIENPSSATTIPNNASILIDNNSFVYDNGNGTITFNFKLKDYYDVNGNLVTSFPSTFDRKMTLTGFSFFSNETSFSRSDAYLSSPLINMQPTEVEKILNDPSTNPTDNSKAKDLAKYFFIFENVSNTFIDQYSKITNFRASNPNNNEANITISFDINGYLEYNQNGVLTYINNKPKTISYQFNFFKNVKKTDIRNPLVLNQQTNMLTHEFVNGCILNTGQINNDSQQTKVLKQAILDKNIGLIGDLPDPTNPQINITDIYTVVDGQQISLLNGDKSSVQYLKALDKIDAEQSFNIKLTLDKSYDESGQIIINKEFTTVVDGKTNNVFNRVEPTRFINDATYIVPNQTQTDTIAVNDQDVKDYIIQNYTKMIGGTIPQYFDISRDLIIKNIDKSSMRAQGKIIVDVSLKNYFNNSASGSEIIYDNPNGYNDITRIILSGYDTITPTTIINDANVTNEPSTVSVFNTKPSIAADGSTYIDPNGNNKIKMFNNQEWQEIIYNNAISGGKKDISPNDITNITILNVDDLNGTVTVQFDLLKAWGDGQNSPSTQLTGCITTLHNFYKQNKTTILTDKNTNKITINSNQPNYSASEFYNQISTSEGWKQRILNSINIQNLPDYYFDENNNYVQTKIDPLTNIQVGDNNRLTSYPTDPTTRGYYIDDVKGTITFSNVWFKYYYNDVNSILSIDNYNGTNDNQTNITYDFKNIQTYKNVVQTRTPGEIDSECITIEFTGFKVEKNTEVYENYHEFNIVNDPILSQYAYSSIWFIYNKLNEAPVNGFNPYQKDFIKFLFNNMFLPNTNKTNINENDIEIIPWTGNEIDANMDKMNGSFKIKVRLNKYWSDGTLQTNPPSTPIERVYCFTGFEAPRVTNVYDQISIDVSQQKWATSATNVENSINNLTDPYNAEIINFLQNAIFNLCLKKPNNYIASINEKSIINIKAINPNINNGTLTVQFNIDGLWLHDKPNDPTSPISYYSYKPNGINNKTYEVYLIGIKPVYETTIINPININDQLIDKNGFEKYDVSGLSANQFLTEGYNGIPFDQTVKNIFANNTNLIQNPPTGITIDQNSIQILNKSINQSDNSITVEFTINGINDTTTGQLKKFTTSLTGFGIITTGPTKLDITQAKQLSDPSLSALSNFVNQNNLTAEEFVKLINTNIPDVNALDAFNQAIFNSWVIGNKESLSPTNVKFDKNSIDLSQSIDGKLTIGIYLDKFHADVNANGTVELIDNSNQPIDQQIQSAKANGLYKIITITQFKLPTAGGITIAASGITLDVRDFAGFTFTDQPSGSTPPILKNLLPSQVTNNSQEYIKYFYDYLLLNVYSGETQGIINNSYYDYKNVYLFNATPNDQTGEVNITLISLKKYYGEKNGVYTICENGCEATNIKVIGFQKSKQTKINVGKSFDLTSNTSWIDAIPDPTWKSRMLTIKEKITNNDSTTFFNEINNPNGTISKIDYQIYVLKWVTNYYLDNVSSPELEIFIDVPTSSDLSAAGINKYSPCDFRDYWPTPQEENNLSTYLNSLYCTSNNLTSPTIVKTNQIEVQFAISPVFNSNSTTVDNSSTTGYIFFTGFNSIAEPTIVYPRDITTNEIDNAFHKNLPKEELWQNRSASDVCADKNTLEIIKKSIINFNFISGRVSNDINSISNIDITNLISNDTQGTVYVKFVLLRQWEENATQPIDTRNKEYEFKITNFNKVNKTSETEQTSSILPLVLGGVAAGVVVFTILIIVIIYYRRKRDIEYQE